MSIFDLTHCTRDGNPCLLDLSTGHPIKKPLDVDENVFFNYQDQSDAFWDNEFSRFTKIGRFGDTIQFRDLTNDMSFDEVAKYFGNLETGQAVVGTSHIFLKLYSHYAPFSVSPSHNICCLYSMRK